MRIPKALLQVVRQARNWEYAIVLTHNNPGSFLEGPDVRQCHSSRTAVEGNMIRTTARASLQGGCVYLYGPGAGNVHHVSVRRDMLVLIV